MKYIIPLLLCLIATPALAQTGALSGSIKNKKGEPLEFINVLIKDTQSGTITNKDGYYLFKGIPSGKITVTINSLGYETKEKSIEIKENETTVLNIELAATELTLQTVEILGRSETSYQNKSSFIGTKSATALKDVPQSIGYVTKELALDQGAFRVNDVVKNISGVNQFTFYNDITIRGHRIQGQKTSGNLVNGMRAMTSFWKQQLIPHIERVEVIKGPASALFGNASAGGTINRVTKKPLKESRKSVSSTIGSFNTFRVLGDFTGPMTEDETLLFRLNLGYENSGNFRDLQYDKNLVVAPLFHFYLQKKQDST